MIYRNAIIEDISAINELQIKYHISTIREEEKAEGFVTTLNIYCFGRKEILRKWRIFLKFNL